MIVILLLVVDEDVGGTMIGLGVVALVVMEVDDAVVCFEVVRELFC